VHYEEALEYANSIKFNYIEVQLSTGNNVENLFKISTDAVIQAKSEYHAALVFDRELELKKKFR
jgi:hypothetical protein